MTCHVAIAGAAGTVVLADSQSSTPTSEQHGLQKIFAGPDFLVCGAGNAFAVTAVFEALQNKTITSLSIESWIQEFFADELTPAVGAGTHLLVVVPGVNGIHHYVPGLRRSFCSGASFAATGSGAEFVTGARTRDAALGAPRSTTHLQDAFMVAESYIDAANESLTVNDKLLAGFIIGRRTYVAGDREVMPKFVPAPLVSNWPEASNRFAEILALARTVRSELQQAGRTIAASVAIGRFGDREKAELDLVTSSIAINRAMLGLGIAKYTAFVVAGTYVIVVGAWTGTGRSFVEAWASIWSRRAS